jgi:hypothetical protein
MDRTPLFALTLNVGDVASRTGPGSKALSAPGAPRRQLRCAKAWGQTQDEYPPQCPDTAHRRTSPPSLSHTYPKCRPGQASVGAERRAIGVTTEVRPEPFANDRPAPGFDPLAGALELHANGSLLVTDSPVSVPEPGTALLLGLGSLGLVTKRRRRTCESVNACLACDPLQNPPVRSRLSPRRLE